MADESDTPETDEKVVEPTAADVEDDATAPADEIDSPSQGLLARVRQRASRLRQRASRLRLSRTGSALVASAAVLAMVTGLTGWLGYLAYEKRQAHAQRDLFVQIARQGAVNLTTINYTEVDADVQRIIDLSTGAFRDDFLQRSKPFIEVVKAAQSKSEGTVTDAGLETQRGDSAQVLVAIAVKSRTAGGEEAPREWRMRIEVQSVGDDAKVSNVVFVP
jgi:Mce-associated membrane protein